MKFEVYSRRGLSLRRQWYWRLRASNGRIIATSAEGYVDRRDAYHGIGLVQQASSAPVLEG